MNFKAKSELLVLVFRINVISNFGCRSLCTDFLPPSSGVFRLSLAGSWPGIPCRRSFGFQGSMRSCRKHITIIQAFLGRIRSGFEGENRTWEVRFLWTALDRAYHNNTQIFRRWYFRFLPLKPEVIVPVLRNIEWINDDFPKTNFSPRNLLIQRLLRYAVGTVYVLNIGFWRSPTIVFEVGFEKSDSKLVSWHQLALLAAVANSKIFLQKNNRPLQVELENGRSRLQNDFQIWEARWKVS